MRLKLFNGATTSLNIEVLAGGFDQETGKMTLIVKADGNSAGMLTLDQNESNKLVAVLTKDSKTSL